MHPRVVTHHLTVRRSGLPVVDESQLEALAADPLAPEAIAQREAVAVQLEAISPKGLACGEDTQVCAALHRAHSPLDGARQCHY